MNAGEALRSALENLAAHKLRSALTMLGMIFGVGAVIAMLSIGAGAERQALAMIERLGLRNVLVRAKSFKDDELQQIRRRSPGLSRRDAAAIAEALRGVELAAPRVRIEPYAVMSASGGRAPGAQVYGVGPAQAGLSHLVLGEGRFLDPLDELGHAQVCVLGPVVRRQLFGYGAAVGKLVKVNDVWLAVVGVLAGDAPAGESVAAPGGSGAASAGVGGRAAGGDGGGGGAWGGAVTEGVEAAAAAGAVAAGTVRRSRGSASARWRARSTCRPRPPSASSSTRCCNRRSTRSSSA